MASPSKIDVIDISSPSPAKQSPKQSPEQQPLVTFGDFSGDAVEEVQRIAAAFPTLEEAALMPPPKRSSPSKGRREWKPLEGRKRTTETRSPGKSPAKSPAKKMQRVSRPPKPSPKAVRQVTRNLLSTFDEPSAAEKESVSVIAVQVRDLQIKRAESAEERAIRRQMLERAKESEDPTAGFDIYDSDLDDPEATVSGFASA